MGTPFAIDIRHLSKRFKNGVLANDAIDLGVPCGVVFGLLGPNGAGKTTLVRQITGELGPSSGSVHVLGIDVLQEPHRAKSLMGIVPQEADVFMALTPEEHLRLFGRLRGLSRAAAAARAQELLGLLDLREHRKQRSFHLSGGLKRKLLVGMAIVASPKVLVLDEPTTGLDPNSRRQVWGLIRSLKQEGASILLTTHNMEEAEALCTSVAILDSGRVLAHGDIEAIRALCRHRFKGTYRENGAGNAVYAQTHAEVVGRLESLGVEEYTVARTTLEDLYLELTRKGRVDEHG
jgi:ABC-type multidrug transport system ATPase subunit